MIIWLENFLRNSDRPYMIISHDRHFLDKTVTSILELRHGKLHTWGGNYTQYLEEFDRRSEQQEKEYKAQQKFINKTEDFIRKNMAGQKVSMAKSRLKMLNKMERIDKVAREKDVKIRFAPTSRSGNDVYRIENAGFGFNNDVLASGINLNIFIGDRIALVGKNGCGKTTLLRILNGEIPLKSGSLYSGASLKVAYYDQMHIRLDDTINVYDTIEAMFPGEPRGVTISYLARFGFFEDDWDKPVQILSGGEKARLYFARLILTNPNILILDEPTNHFDLTTIAHLEKALNEFQGTIIFVSHDLFFIKNVANRIWHFRNKSVNETELSPEEIFKVETMQIKRQRKSDTRENSPRTRINPQKIEKLMTEIENTEQSIKNLEVQIGNLESQFAQPEIYTDKEKVQILRREIEDQKNALQQSITHLDELETRFLELSE